MANQQRPVTIYAVLDLDYRYNTEPDGARQSDDDDDDYENNIIYALTYKLQRKIDEIVEKNNEKKRKRKVVNVTVVGAADKSDASCISVLLERVLCLLNAISEPIYNNKKTVVRFKDFVLLNKNKYGKVLRPRTGHLLASDSPPSDVSGHLVFLTSRPYTRALLKDKRSWWGSTAGRLTSVSKLKWTGIR